jgi:hypothetical protein
LVERCSSGPMMRRCPGGSHWFAKGVTTAAITTTKHWLVPNSKQAKPTKPTKSFAKVPAYWNYWLGGGKVGRWVVVAASF